MNNDNGGQNVTVGELKDYYLMEIERRKEEIADFENKLLLLEKFDEDTKLVAESEKKYSGWTLTPAVVDAVNTLCKAGLKNSNGIEAYDVYLYLCQMGFQGAKNLAVAVHTTLRRLAADGRIIMTKDDSFKRRYKPTGNM